MQLSPIPFYYSTHHPNLGDIVNPLLAETVFRCPTYHVDSRWALLFGIGSVLGKVFAWRFALGRRLSGRSYPAAVIWTSGFLDPPAASQVPFRKLDVRALRGRRSREILEQRTGRKFAVPLGDGGLLLDELLPERPDRTIAVGLIPHYRELASPELEAVRRRLPGAEIISPLGDPIDILRRIAACESILSSSLHGLIAADAFGIPNRHLLLPDSGRSRFKYEDYYSVFGLDDTPVTDREILRDGITPEQIRRQYRIAPDQVAEIRGALRDAFPFPDGLSRR